MTALAELVAPDSLSGRMRHVSDFRLARREMRGHPNSILAGRYHATCHFLYCSDHAHAGNQISSSSGLFIRCSPSSCKSPSSPSAPLPAARVEPSRGVIATHADGEIQSRTAESEDKGQDSLTYTPSICLRPHHCLLQALADFHRLS